MKAILLIFGLILGFILLVVPVFADTVTGKVIAIDPNEPSITVSTASGELKVFLKEYMAKGGSADFLDVGLDVEARGKPNPAGGLDAVKILRLVAPQEEPMPDEPTRRVKYSDADMGEAVHATDLEEIRPTETP